jgi:hypothetical protein
MESQRQTGPKPRRDRGQARYLGVEEELAKSIGCWEVKVRVRFLEDWSESQLYKHEHDYNGHLFQQPTRMRLVCNNTWKKQRVENRLRYLLDQIRRNWWDRSKSHRQI